MKSKLGDSLFGVLIISLLVVPFAIAIYVEVQKNSLIIGRRWKTTTTVFDGVEASEPLIRYGSDKEVSFPEPPNNTPPERVIYTVSYYLLVEMDETGEIQLVKVDRETFRNERGRYRVK